MISQDQLQRLTGATAYDRDGDKIGKVGAIYSDDRTDQPTWITVHTGLFGTNETFVPVQGVEFDGDDRVTLAHDKATVKDAPNVSEDGHLSPEDEQRLYRHYGVEYGSADGGDHARHGDYAAGTAGGDYAGDYAGDRTTDRTTDVAGAGYRDTGRHGLVDEDVDRGVDRGVDAGVTRDRDVAYGDDVEGRTVGRDTSDPNTDRSMTRSEEQLRVGTETREAGRARLRKYVVTEQQNVSVPVSREEVRVEREPITEANRGEAYDGPAISEEEHEVVLREERPVVDTEAVPVERVRLGTETVTDTETVSGEVRKEQIDFDGAEGVTGRGVTDRDRGVVGDRTVGDYDRDGDGVPDSVDRHDDRSVTEKLTDKVTGRDRDADRR